jgi:hypothetical protein
MRPRNICLPLTHLLLWFAFLCSSIHARAILVAKTGGDHTTISVGLNAANAGDTVYVKAGTYNEFVTWPRSGSGPSGSLVLKAYGDGPAILSGSGLTMSQQNYALLLIDSKSYAAIIGLEICRAVTASGSIFNKGIQIEGASQNILIQKCRVHHIENNHTTTAAGANAIGVFGSNGAIAITGVVIDSCEVDSCITGYSEAISIDGNVDGILVSRNYVHDNNNIGILIAGFYGESPVPATDQVRHAIVCDNLVLRCSSCRNPAYQGDCAADGIYSDGAGKSVFERNVVGGCDIGIEAGAELAAAVSDSMIVRDNLVYSCNTGGMFIGGYATGRGVTVNSVVENNTFYLNDLNNTGSGEFLVQKSHDNRIRNNIFYTTAQKRALSNAFNATYCYNNAIAYNLFYSTSGGTGIDGTSLDAQAVTGNPLFTTAGSDFRLQAGSAAINAGDPAFTAASGEMTLDGNVRVLDGRVDIGAYEYSPSAIRPARLTAARQYPRIIDAVYTLAGHRLSIPAQKLYLDKYAQRWGTGVYVLVSRSGERTLLKKTVGIR